MALVRGRVVEWVGVSLLAVLGSCRSEPIAVIVAGAPIVTDSWEDNALTADVAAVPEDIWPSVCRTLSFTSDELLEVDDDHRQISTRIDNTEVVVHILHWDVDETRIYVEAQKYMLHHPEVAQLVMESIVSDLRTVSDLTEL